MRLCPLQRQTKIFQGVLKQKKTASDNICTSYIDIYGCI